MILETAHMLNIPWRLARGEQRIGYVNHPCSKWARASKSNYKWLCRLGIALCDEFEHRRGKRHKTRDKIEWCQSNIPKLSDIGLTPFAQAMPDDFKDDDPVQAYRWYYAYYKAHLYGYTKRQAPEWLVNLINK